MLDRDLKNVINASFKMVIPVDLCSLDFSVEIRFGIVVEVDATFAFFVTFVIVVSVVSVLFRFSPADLFASVRVSYTF